MSRRSLRSLALLLAALLPTTATAMQIGGPSVITPSTTMTARAGFPLAQIADGITSDLSPFNGFAATVGEVGTIRLDLNTSYTLGAFVLWNDINVFREGIRDFRLEFYNASNTLLSSTGVLTGPLGQLAPATYTFSPVFGVKRVDLIVINLNPPGPLLEIREVAFETSNATPTLTTTWSRVKGLYR